MTEFADGQVEYLAPSDKWRSLAKQGEGPSEEQKKAQDSLKEGLLSSLQMQNIVVLTGSGTSISIGGPSMIDLWNIAIGSPVTPTAVKVAGVIKYDIKTLYPNIEDFLSRCDAYLQINDDKDVRTFVSNCKKVILEKCSSFLSLNRLDGHKTFLHRLSRRRARDPRLKIFTTNYDLCFEQAAGDLGLVVVDGFSFTQPRNYDPRFFSYDIVRRSPSNEDQSSYLEGVFHLYKLHGSVNWARRHDGCIEEKQKPLSDEACLIYPARGKYQQSFIQPHLEIVSQYFSTIREPNTCLIVIGFGFNDDHLSAPILSAVRSNPHIRLIVIDNLAKDLINGVNNPSHYWGDLYELSKQGEDIWFINASFSEFAKLIPDLKSLTPAEKLLKDIQKIAEVK